MADVSKFKLGNTTYNIRDDVARSGYIRVFDTVAEMQAATDLSAGMICRTNGFHAIDDNGAGFYVIESNKTANNMNILACQNSLFATLLTTEGTIRPEMYGAYGDNTHDDTDVLIAIINSGKPVSFTPFATYHISRQVTITGQNNISIEGNGASLKMNYLNSDGRTILGIVDSSDVMINNVRITTDYEDDGAGENDEDTDLQFLFNTGPYGISVNNCTRVRITHCDVSLVQDGISVNDSTEVMVMQNRIYNVGQEPIASRQSYGVTIGGNDLYWHVGDGILVKAYNEDIMSNIVIEGNLIHDPKPAVSSSNVQQLGGGITCNAENTSDVYLTKGMIISNNTIDGCRYGVELGNISNAIISNNVAKIGTVNGIFVAGSSAFGLELETAYNPSTPKTMSHVLFSNNIAIGGKVQFRSYYNDSSAPAEAIVFEGNIGLSGELATSDFCFYAQNSTIINNVVSGATRIGEFFNCVIRGNEMSDPVATPTSPQTSDYYFRGDTCIVEGNKLSGHQVYFNCGTLAHITNNEFSLDVTTQGIKVNCASTAHVWFDGNTFNGIEIIDSNVYLGGTTANILTDFYRRYSITVNSTEVGYINANRDTIMVYADVDYATGTTIVTVSDAYFRPNTSNKQIVGFVTTNTSAARVAYQTNGILVVRAATTNTGHIVINATMHK